MLQLISNCVTLVVSPTLAVNRFPKAWQSLFGCARGSATGDCDETAIEVVGMDIRDDLELLEIVVGKENEVGEMVAREDAADEARFSLLSRIAVSEEKSCFHKKRLCRTHTSQVQSNCSYFLQSLNPRALLLQWLGQVE